MKLKKYLFLIFSLTLISLGVWLLIIFNQNEEKADLVTHGAFFASLFVLVSGFLTLVLFYFRIYFSNREVVFLQLFPASRQSILISLTFVSMLILQSLKVLTWWDVILVVLIVILLELFFKTRKVIKS